MTVKQLIEELKQFDPGEPIEYDYITTCGIITLAKDQFDKVITKDQAIAILCTISDGVEDSGLVSAAYYDIYDLLIDEGAL